MITVHYCNQYCPVIDRPEQDVNKTKSFLQVGRHICALLSMFGPDNASVSRESVDCTSQDAFRAISGLKCSSSHLPPPPPKLHCSCRALAYPQLECLKKAAPNSIYITSSMNTNNVNDSRSNLRTYSLHSSRAHRPFLSSRQLHPGDPLINGHHCLAISPNRFPIANSRAR